jgi:hypothetical protein
MQQIIWQTYLTCRTFGEHHNRPSNRAVASIEDCQNRARKSIVLEALEQSSVRYSTVLRCEMLNAFNVVKEIEIFRYSAIVNCEIKLTTTKVIDDSWKGKGEGEK